MISLQFFFFLTKGADGAKLTRRSSRIGRVLEIGVASSERAALMDDEGH